MIKIIINKFLYKDVKKPILIILYIIAFSFAISILGLIFDYNFF